MSIIWQISGISLNYRIPRIWTSSISQIEVNQEDAVVQISQTNYIIRPPSAMTWEETELYSMGNSRTLLQ